MREDGAVICELFLGADRVEGAGMGRDMPLFTGAIMLEGRVYTTFDIANSSLAFDINKKLDCERRGRVSFGKFSPVEKI